ncbi:MAG: hypothetical protein R3190_08800 [Thermoanaerobaculia bacterium]|nr:hypothetical protein [Thermoanaerobaculia bacterium]
MVVFVSLFLGLTVGTHAVEVGVAGPVASVEIRLDERRVGVMAGEPWRLAVDFGDDLRPHELVAVARDGDGRELDRQVLWVNLPRSTIEARLLFEGDADRVERARVVWESVLDVEPERVRVSLDGRPLAFVDLGAIELPDLDAGALHRLRVVMDFGRGRVVDVTGAFGAELEESETLLTAIPVRGPRGGRGLEVEDVVLVRASDRRRLEVQAVDGGGGMAVIVRAEGVAETLARMGRPGRDLPRGLFDRREARSIRLHGTKVGAGSQRPGGYAVFDISPELTRRDGRAHDIVTGARLPSDGLDLPERVADAVASAGVAAAESGRPRAVVLLVGREEDDASEFSVAEVRRFLASIAVPLLVWSVGEATPSLDAAAPGLPRQTRWGSAAQLVSARAIEDAYEALRAELRSQRIAWVRGRHPPHRVAAGEGSAATIVD